MHSDRPLRKKFKKLRGTPGPKPTWQATAAKELGYHKSYISRLVRDQGSVAARAELAEWKRIHKVA